MSGSFFEILQQPRFGIHRNLRHSALTTLSGTLHTFGTPSNFRQFRSLGTLRHSGIQPLDTPPQSTSRHLHSIRHLLHYAAISPLRHSRHTHTFSHIGTRAGPLCRGIWAFGGTSNPEGGIYGRIDRSDSRAFDTDGLDRRDHRSGEEEVATIQGSTREGATLLLLSLSARAAHGD